MRWPTLKPAGKLLLVANQGNQLPNQVTNFGAGGTLKQAGLQIGPIMYIIIHICQNHY